jgi:hypothetical protein
MLKEKTLSISIFCLSISFIISALILANGMKSNGEYVGSGLSNMSQGLNNIGNTINNYNNSVVDGRRTYDLRAAALYLGISEESLMNIVNSKDSGIPYIKISSSAYVFSKSALDKWLETARIEVK